MTSKTRVAVIYGGKSTEHSVSCVTAGAIMNNLDPQRYEIVPIAITREGTWTIGVTEGLEIKDGKLPEVEEADELTVSLNPQGAGQIHNVTRGTLHAEVDVAFPALHGVNGEDGTIQGVFEMAGIPYVGPGVMASAVGMDKEFMRKLMAAEGLPVTRDVILRGRTELTEEEKDFLGLPVFVKPARGGSSIGVSKVSSWDELDTAIAEAAKSDDKVIVEAELIGAEVEVGVLEYPDGKLVASVPAKLNGTEDSEEGFYGFDTKYLDNTVTATIPAPFDDDTIKSIQDLAIETFKSLNCEGLSRIDFFVTDNGPMINEINTLPGFTPISMYPQVFLASGVSYPELLDTLLATALAKR
ncbi:D-alanine--D-alanine ligase family protein [Corynebacterium stationis]|uniref:D-alanine--D-alanine ligase n=1 Tax=Corynebacterium stationis TaxID=1705 RepID=A0A0X8VF77_9CORY|nr:D-alanine--D-alanine ligase family protein [Corynebacterium stationis]AMJ44746.1 D-alanine--D-alanine ligase [Corynebacterium stationis]APT95157.1 D-alanine--D-alanine ligase [Corynebacterium stationis]AQX71202.1 D-alanine--D-alanine ligase [Corynebacterium stationis]ASJ18890.1 D-alanine--D-alanine ligase A [Corynebacterium stationis]OAH25769.1 D-alanine--D-alanine ligase [Corynebacterium stationis]